MASEGAGHRGVESPGHRGCVTSETPIIVAEPTSTWVFLGVASPLLGAGGLWLIKAVAGWIASLPAAPLQGWFGLASGVPEPWATLAALAAGAVGGLAFAVRAHNESLRVIVDPERLAIDRPGGKRGWSRGEVSAVFQHGGELVVLGARTEELARESCGLDAELLRKALRAHGYPWCRDGDPHEHAYRRWVRDLPDLPAAADALFAARERALRDREAADAADLRAEIARLDLVVRDAGWRQYWRPAPPSPPQ